MNLNELLNQFKESTKGSNRTITRKQLNLIQALHKKEHGVYLDLTNHRAGDFIFFNNMQDIAYVKSMPNNAGVLSFEAVKSESKVKDEYTLELEKHKPFSKEWFNVINKNK